MVIEDRAGYAESLLVSEHRIGLATRWFLLALGLFSTRFVQTFRTSVWLAGGFLAYALLALSLTLREGLAGSVARYPGRGVVFVLYAADVAFVSLIVRFGADYGLELSLLYWLLALRAGLYYPLYPEVVLFPLSLGLVYVVTLRMALGSWMFLAEPAFLVRYALLFCLVLVSFYLGWMNERGRARESGLRQSLAERTLDLDAKTRATQQMAANLGNRVLELRTLQEGIKAISSALALEDVLRLIVANASQVLEGARCSVVLLGGEHGGVTSMSSLDRGPGTASRNAARFDREAAAWVVGQGKPVLLEDVKGDSGFLLASEVLVSTLISAPLYLGDAAIGALIATSSDSSAFSEEDLSLLSAFADQASVAVSNARLYEQLVQEQKQTAQLYQHVEERRKELEAILRGIGDGVIVADPELELLLMNPVAARMFGVKPDVAGKQKLSQLVSHEELLTLMGEALKGEGEAVVKEIPLVLEQPHAQGESEAATGGSRQPARSEEEEATYQALASPILSAEGQVRGVVTVLRDITTQKELERMKSNFLSVVSHELKTPLHSIKGFVEIILMGKTGPISETQADFLNTVRDQTAHLQNLIDDLLEFSRLDSGQVKLRLSDVSLTDTALAVLDKLKPLADQEKIQLAINMGDKVPAVQADRMRIEQVLTNLVHNAIKFTPPSGTVTVGIRALVDEVQVSVADTGIGIPASQMDRVFDRFYQVDGGPTRHYRGTGLGLTISKHIVEYHHGRIWVESEEGSGSTFSFVLPQHLEADEAELLLDFMSLPDKGTE